MRIVKQSKQSLRLGDCLDVLKSLPENYFDSCVTDPPYEIAILGHGWDSTGIAHRHALWRQVYRVLKPGAWVFAFAAPKTYHRLACAIEDAGFDIDDMFVWLKGGANMLKGGWVAPSIDKHLGAIRKQVGERTLYGTAALSIAERGGTHSVGVKSNGAKKVVPITESATDQAKQWDGWAWNLRPGHEPIVMARKPPEGARVASLLKWGTGALNLSACAIPAATGEQSRLPTNIALTPEAAHVLSLQSGETRCASNKRPTKQAGRAFHGNGKPQVWAPEALNKGDEGTAERYFAKFLWCRKANKLEKGDSCPIVSVKPLPLMQYLLRLSTPAGGISLEPFAGSGSTLEAARLEGFDCFGIEKSADHFDFAKRHWSL